jgi:hypothetical protein
MNWGMPPILSKFNRFQLEDGFIKHAQLAVSVGAGDVGAEVHLIFSISLKSIVNNSIVNFGCK